MKPPSLPHFQNPSSHPHYQLGSFGGSSRRRRKKSRSLSEKQNTVTIGLPMFGSNGAASAAAMAATAGGSSSKQARKLTQWKTHCFLKL